MLRSSPRVTATGVTSPARAAAQVEAEKYVGVSFHRFAASGARSAPPPPAEVPLPPPDVFVSKEASERP